MLPVVNPGIVPVVTVVTAESDAFPALSTTCVLTSYLVFWANPPNVALDCNAPHVVSEFFFIWYWIDAIPDSLSVCLFVAVILLVVFVVVGAVVVGAVLSIFKLNIFATGVVFPLNSTPLT